MPHRRAAMAAEARGTDGMFQPVEAGRVSDLIIDQIRELILSGRLPPGERLPAERDLAERTGVSRVTVRDALRVLEAQGIIEIRVGTAGGAFVTAPSSEKVGEGISTMLKLETLRPEDVAEARLIMELGAAALAIQRATDADIDRLEGLCQLAERQHAEGHYDVGLSSQFHIAIAATAHNTALRLLTELFTGPLSMKAVRATEPPARAHGQTVAEHRRILDALESRDLLAFHKTLVDHLIRGTAIDPRAARALAST